MITYRTTTSLKAPQLFQKTLYVRKSQHLHFISHKIHFHEQASRCSGFESPRAWKVRAPGIFSCWRAFSINLKARNCINRAILFWHKPLLRLQLHKISTQRMGDTYRQNFNYFVYPRIYFPWPKLKTIYNGGKGKQFLQERADNSLSQPLLNSWHQPQSRRNPSSFA